MGTFATRRVAAGLLAAALLGTAGAAGALEIRVAAAGLDAPRIEASRGLIAEVDALLPPALRERTWTVELHWRADLPRDVHGRAIGRRVLLRADLLDGWMARDRSRGTADPGARAALAALIHELVHVHDRTPGLALSREPRLLDLAGWQAPPMRGMRRLRRTDFTDRSPDPYETTSPAEFLAVNVEHLLLDPNYACRRPAVHRLLAAKLGMPPTPTDCPPDQAFMQAPQDTESPLLRIDPKRVHAVDYLLAEPDGAPMSRWGHSMLRLVVCAPGRPAGPDCRLDIAHHRVLSFRAFVDDVQISSWRGLTGSYPSRLFVLPLAQVIDEYTKYELRGLRSVPLRLSPDEIGDLLERAAQVHWSYDGRYRFVSRNCAVETFRLLHDGVPRLARRPLASLTPTGLLRRLEREGVADASVLADAEAARRLGYRFDAQHAHYRVLFDAARRSLPLPAADVQVWLALPPATRAQWIDSAGLQAAAALLVLENAALRREEIRARHGLKRGALAPGARLGDEARAALHLADQLTRPAALAGIDGYGLPQPAERERVAREGAKLAAAWQAGSVALRDAGRQALSPARRARLDGIEANVTRLGDRLRTLAAGPAPAGG